jgi:uncharacterized membrane protein
VSQLGKLNRKTKIIASIAIFASLYTVLRMMQTIPMIGVQGGSFSPSDVLAPLYGIILGSYVGGASVILGTFLAMALGRPVSFMFLDFLPALVNTVALGFLVRRKWTPAIVLNAALLAVFLLNPLTSIFVNVPLGNITISFPFAWMHIAAFVVLLSPLGRKAGQWVEMANSARITAGIAILAFIGTMMQHLMGGILTEVVRGQILGLIPLASFSTVIWPTVFFVYPWERLVLILLAVVVGTPLARALKDSFFRFEK